ncbi:DUF6949 family protein [Pseudovibrio exalbescens]|uniref:DUF6949 family protein n=1 Tax=Pseudovibrio exalbescens TaxID=197461 RepID=UPI000C9AF427|nr:hypothetical protein [Pseudovibrio exalbescens]
MVHELFVAAFLCVSGFVSAGILSSFYQLVTGEPPKFRVPFDNALKATLSMIFVLMIGPFLLMRSGFQLYRVEGRPFGWLMASAVLSCLWSVQTGLFIVYVALVL